MKTYATQNSACTRRYNEPASSIIGFESDRERILKCSAFRRLDYKTQVFVPHEHDMFRTRMTHTLEVAQVSRTISRALDINEDLAEAVALAHDLGHPPFGHAGEEILDKLMSDHGHFEHNRQSLRVVDYLEHPQSGYRGLNLAEPTRECIAKHETSYDTPLCVEFDTSLRPPLEGQICDASDEIAYTSADIEDGLASGWITEEQISTLDLWQEARRMAEKEFPQARDIHKRIAATRNIARILRDDLILNTQKNISDLNIVTPEDVKNAEKCAIMSQGISSMFSQMKTFLLNELYLHQAHREKEQRAEIILKALFNAFTNDPNLLPARYRKRIDQPGQNENIEGLQRITCDYIAGMTDRFAHQVYEELTGTGC